jgi:MFS family permease
MRILLAIFQGGFQTIAVSIISDHISEKNRIIAFSIYTMGIVFGSTMVN